ncbi:hypothetical protein NCCP1664_01830 [Zafaria cholistanensis]|uniref:Mutator family transposase n=1 Tax=Zafaria cholistanensis TaxID=1682741 RepID=A0A5A7NMF9_9MICC|nr:hypothetical protein NCCP1664_01830 [Zafaria cholistanensis]
MAEWSNRPLDRVYLVIFIDAIHTKVRDGQVRNKLFYILLGVTVNGERNILKDLGRGWRRGRQVLARGSDRGQEPRCGGRVHRRLRRAQGSSGGDHHPVGAGDGADLRHRACRNTFKYAPRQHWDELSRDLRPVYTAATEAAARKRLAELEAKWGPKYPAIPKLWHGAWASVRPVPKLGRRDP